MAKRVRSVRALSGVGVVAVVGAMLAGCSSAATEPPGLNASASPTATPTPTPTPDPDAADVAAIRKVHDAFRAAEISMENGAEVDPSALYGIASDEIITNQVNRVADFIRMGIHRVGAPVIGEPVIVVNGDKARLEVCFNNDTWHAADPEGKEVTTSDGSLANVLDLTKVDGHWQVSHIAPDAEATLKC